MMSLRTLALILIRESWHTNSIYTMSLVDGISQDLWSLHLPFALPEVKSSLRCQQVPPVQSIQKLTDDIPNKKASSQDSDRLHYINTIEQLTEESLEFLRGDEIAFMKNLLIFCGGDLEDDVFEEDCSEDICFDLDPRKVAFKQRLHYESHGWYLARSMVIFHLPFMKSKAPSFVSKFLQFKVSKS